MTTRERTLHRHACQSAHTGASQQAKKYGFHLIIAMLGRQQHLTWGQFRGQCRIAGLAGSLFNARFFRHPHSNRPERHAELRAHCRAMFRPLRRDSLKTMTDMQRPQRRQNVMAAQASQQMQQHRGVQPTGEGQQPARRLTPGLQDGQQGLFETVHWPSLKQQRARRPVVLKLKAITPRHSSSGVRSDAPADRRYRACSAP